MQNNHPIINKLKKSNLNSHRLDRLAKPYFIWLYIFACFPVLIMFFLMFVDAEGIRLEDMVFTMFNFSILSDTATIKAFINSVKFSVITTIICIFFGYLLAYSLYKSKLKHKYLILLLLILPMWTNILLRISALSNIFKPNNMITDLLGITGINIIGTDLAIILGMVFTYLPFIVLPIYTSLEKIDPSLEEAATDLGMTDLMKFWTVIVPLSMKGVVSGATMVLLPCLSGFAIPQILGDGKVTLIGNIIEKMFIDMFYNQGAVLAIVMLVVILGSILLVNKVDKEGETLL